MARVANVFNSASMCFLLNNLLVCTLFTSCAEAPNTTILLSIGHFIQINCNLVDAGAHAYTKLVVSQNGGELEGLIGTAPSIFLVRDLILCQLLITGTVHKAGLAVLVAGTLSYYSVIDVCLRLFLSACSSLTLHVDSIRSSLYHITGIKFLKIVYLYVWRDELNNTMVMMRDTFLSG